MWNFSKYCLHFRKWSHWPHYSKTPPSLIQSTMSFLSVTFTVSGHIGTYKHPITSFYFLGLPCPNTLKHTSFYYKLPSIYFSHLLHMNIMLTFLKLFIGNLNSYYFHFKILRAIFQISYQRTNEVEALGPLASVNIFLLWKRNIRDRHSLNHSVKLLFYAWRG